MHRSQASVNDPRLVRERQQVCHQEERGRTTDMGHADWLEDASDRRMPVTSPFATIEDVLAFDAVEEYGLPDFDELVARIQALLRRSKGTMANERDRHVLRLGGIAFDSRSLEVTYRDQRITLTDKERQILQLLLVGPDRIHSRERIINAVWGSTEDPLTNIVDVYVARLRKKLGAAGKAIETVRGVGYRLSSSGL